VHAGYTARRLYAANAQVLQCCYLDTYSNGFGMTSYEFDFKIQHYLPASNQNPSLDSIRYTQCTYVW
jgi:hypothetical protein